MILRTLIGFSIGLALAACDRDNQYIPGGFDLVNDPKPSMKGSITCCRCVQPVCKTMTVTVCPPGWEPSGGGNGGGMGETIPH